MNAAVAFWKERKTFLLEGFLLFNLAFLALDIYIAHSVNDFERGPEWIPFVFSLVATAALAPAFIGAWVKRDLAFGRGATLTFGVLSVLVGVAGLAFHLESQFLREQSLKHLVYTAPFVAPLAYSGVGSLLIFNRLYADDPGWAHGVAFGALGGYFGNFVLTLCDHAQNGFFHPAEWIAVAASALATGFLAAAVLFAWKSPAFLRTMLAVMAFQVAVGTTGFFLHSRANFRGDVQNVLERFIHGAPTFAPMLLINITVIAGAAWIDWWLASQSNHNQ